MTQMTVGIRELKTHLSRYLRQVKAGATLVITDRGKPIGQIVPINRSLEEKMQELIHIGAVAWNGRELRAVDPVANVRGDKTVAELLIEDRE